MSLMKASSSRAKGKLLEDHIADRIVALGIDPKARRDGGSGNGNREKGDIITSMTVLGVNAGIEAKNQKTLCIPDWWRQTKKLESLSREPILAFKQFGEPMGETKVVIYLETFLELVKASQAPRPIVNDDPEIERVGDDRTKKYKLEAAKRAINEALKVL